MPRVVFAFGLLGALYGVSYQQFLHFDLQNPIGLLDTLSYVRMSQGDFAVVPVHRYRFLIPVLANLVRRPLALVVRDPQTVLVLPFYVVNFCVMFLAATVLVASLRRLGFSLQVALLGLAIFLTSRMTIVTTATPLVDSLYFLTVGIVMFCMLGTRVGLLAVLAPVLVLSKETAIPFLLLPLVVREFRCRTYALSLLVSCAGMVSTHAMIDASIANVQGLGATTGGLGAAVLTHVAALGRNAVQLFSPAGLHAFQNGFSFFLPFALLGFHHQLRGRGLRLPSYLPFFVVIAFGFALLSGDYGRMLFAAYPAIIAYALVFIQHVFGAHARFEGRRGSPAA